MGIKHSKPRIKRRFSSRSVEKRRNPEGGPSPPSATCKDADEMRCCEQVCPCNKLRHFSPEEENRLKNNNNCIASKICLPPAIKHEEEGLSLKVDLPRETLDGEASEKAATDIQADKESEWILTLYDDDAKQLTQQEELSRLMKSIRTAVDNEIEQCDKRGKKIRVRLSLTPEPRSRNQIRDLRSISPVSRRATLSCEKTPPILPVTSSSDRHRSASLERTREQSTSGAEEDFHRKDQLERRQHYCQIPGKENDATKDKISKKAETESGTSSRDKTPDRRRDMSPSRSQSRDRPCPGGCCKRHGRCSGGGRDKGYRYQSPFDQRFQEAMYLRLTELQRKTSCQAKLARRAGRNSDSEDSNAESSEDSDSEYSGDDDNCVLGEKTETAGSRMFEPLNGRSFMTKTHGSKFEALAEKKAEKNIGASTTMHHHYYKEGAVEFSLDAEDICSSSKPQLIKPWHKTDSLLHGNGKRKNFKKRRPSATSKPNHGYLRANALSSGVAGTFPNTPKITSKQKPVDTQKSPMLVQRHQHEHIHHHYYYHCESKT